MEIADIQVGKQYFLPRESGISQKLSVIDIVDIYEDRHLYEKYCDDRIVVFSNGARYSLRYIAYNQEKWAISLSQYLYNEIKN